MKPLTLISAIALIWFCALTGAQAQDIVREPSETDSAFAGRVLLLNENSDPHVVAAEWNGVPTLFVDYQAISPEQTERFVVALMRQPDGRYRLVHVTAGEEEGGVAQLAAIGLARTDHSRSQSLITIVTWGQDHPTLVEGTEYEVGIFGAPRPGQTTLTPLRISRHFGGGCECWHGDGPPSHPEYHSRFRYRTIAAIRRELHRLRF